MQESPLLMDYAQRKGIFQAMCLAGCVIFLSMFVWPSAFGSVEGSYLFGAIGFLVCLRLLLVEVSAWVRADDQGVQWRISPLESGQLDLGSGTRL